VSASSNSARAEKIKSNFVLTLTTPPKVKPMVLFYIPLKLTKLFCLNIFLIRRILSEIIAY